MRRKSRATNVRQPSVRRRASDNGASGDERRTTERPAASVGQPSIRRRGLASSLRVTGEEASIWLREKYQIYQGWRLLFFGRGLLRPDLGHAQIIIHRLGTRDLQS